MKRILTILVFTLVFTSCKVQDGHDADGKAFTENFGACSAGFLGDCGLANCAAESILINQAALGTIQTFTGYQDQWGQSFTPSETIDLSSIDIRFRANATVAATSAFLRLYKVSGGATTGSIIATSETNNSISSSYAYHTFQFATPPQLSSGQEYVVFVINDGRVDMQVDTENPHTGGGHWTCPAGCSRDNRDINFRVNKCI